MKMAIAVGEMTNMEWKGLNGWMIWGGKYALCVSGNTGVFVETRRADFNELMKDLFGPPTVGQQATKYRHVLKWGDRSHDERLNEDTLCFVQDVSHIDESVLLFPHK